MLMGDERVEREMKAMRESVGCRWVGMVQGIGDSLLVFFTILFGSLGGYKVGYKATFRGLYHSNSSS